MTTKTSFRVKLKGRLGRFSFWTRGIIPDFDSEGPSDGYPLSPAATSGMARWCCCCGGGGRFGWPSKVAVDLFGLLFQQKYLTSKETSVAFSACVIGILVGLSLAGFMYLWMRRPPGKPLHDRATGTLSPASCTCLPMRGAQPELSVLHAASLPLVESFASA